jgi:exportin-2 (importin alpha re-exporter)
LGFGVGFTQLNTTRRAPRDPFPEITDVKLWVGEYLKQADARTGGRIAGFVQGRLGEQARGALVALMG